MSVLKKLAGETAVYGVSSILGRVLHFVILTPYLTRVFSKGEYGQYTALYAWAALLLVLFTYRMETTFFRFGRKQEHTNQVFSTASLSLLGTTLLYCLVLLGLSNSIARWLDFGQHPEYIRYFVLIIAFDALSAIPFARLRLENRPYLFAIFKVFGIILNIFFIFFLLEVLPWFHPFYDDDKRLGYVFLSNLLASASVFAMLLPAYRHLQWRFNLDLWKRMLRYAGPLIVAAIAGVLNQFVGIPLLRQLGGGSTASNEELVGVYGGNAKLAVLINLFTQAFNYAAEPFFFRNADKGDAKAMYALIGQAFALVGAIAFLGIMLYIDIFKYLIDSGLHEGLGIVPILLLAYICLGLFYNFSIWYKLEDRTELGGYIALGGSFITILINVILIPKMGYYAPALAALACYGFMAYASYATGQKYYAIPYPIRRMLLYFLIAGTGYFLADVGRTIYGDQLGTTLVFNTFVFLGCLYAFFRLERTLILQIIQGKTGQETQPATTQEQETENEEQDQEENGEKDQEEDLQ